MTKYLETFNMFKLMTVLKDEGWSLVPGVTVYFDLFLSFDLSLGSLHRKFGILTP